MRNEIQILSTLVSRPLFEYKVNKHCFVYDIIIFVYDIIILSQSTDENKKFTSDKNYIFHTGQAVEILHQNKKNRDLLESLLWSILEIREKIFLYPHHTDNFNYSTIVSYLTQIHYIHIILRMCFINLTYFYVNRFCILYCL